MIVENKYFQCEKCKKYCIRLIFAPNASTTELMHEFSQMMMNEYIKENCEVWIIGAPENIFNEDSPHLTMQVWPAIKDPKYILPIDFNKRIVSLEENHCKNSKPFSFTQNQLQIIKTINDHVIKFPDNDTGTEQLLYTIYDYMDDFKKIMDTTSSEQINYLANKYPGFGRMARLMELMAERIADGSFTVPKDH